MNNCENSNGVVKTLRVRYAGVLAALILTLVFCVLARPSYAAPVKTYKASGSEIAKASASLGIQPAVKRAGPAKAHLLEYGKMRFVVDDSNCALKGSFVFGKYLYKSNSSGWVRTSTKYKKGLAEKDGKYVFYRKNGKQLKRGWTSNRYFDKKGYAVSGMVKIKKKWYFFDDVTCKLLKGRKNHEVVTADGVTHMVDKSGKAVTGWKKNKKTKQAYYYNAKGVRVYNKVVDGVRIGADGYTAAGAKVKALEEDQSPVMAKARAVVNNITSSNMSRSQKLSRCWSYITGGSFSYASKYPDGGSGWQRRLALNMLNTHSGNCYGFACAFAALAKACGYNPVVVAGLCHGTRDGRADGLTRHCCVKINGAWYDPEAQYAGWGRGIYGSGYSYMRAISSTTYF